MAVPTSTASTIKSQSNSRKRKRKQNVGSNEHTKGAKAIALNELPWTEATLPDRLDDAEGFFGLEEISDVEVFKNEELGRVEYRVDKKIQAEDEWEGISNSDFGDQSVKEEAQSTKPKDLKSKTKRYNGVGDLSKTNGFSALSDDSTEEGD
ncbi:MAG: hypothetical protein Q9222_006004, partial [Ikaeria aurantiellina]